MSFVRKWYKTWLLAVLRIYAAWPGQQNHTGRCRREVSVSGGRYPKAGSPFCILGEAEDTLQIHQNLLQTYTLSSFAALRPDFLGNDCVG